MNLRGVMCVLLRSLQFLWKHCDVGRRCCWNGGSEGRRRESKAKASHISVSVYFSLRTQCALSWADL